MDNFKLFALNLLTDIMEFDDHMLHAAMQNRIGTNTSGANIVVENFRNNNQRKLKLLKKMVSQVVSEIVAATARNSASVEERETERCLFKDHEIGEQPR